MVTKDLKRLTERALLKAEAKGKVAGWYALCTQGYLPEEIAVYAKPMVYANDVRQKVRNFSELHSLPTPASCGRRQERRTPKIPTDWREAFRSKVMRTGFHLDMSQGQLECLCAISDAVWPDRKAMATAIASNEALMKRGLIVHNEGTARGWQLTEAGQLVVDLLKLVGVFYEADQAIERRQGGK